ncbi:MAG: hypothetical protein HRU25_13465 [Psychrobium sp.]|nr:hypothetical protein [Psychrobium sp.]
MNYENFDKCVELELGNFKRLPNYPFNEKMEFAIFPGAEDYYVSKGLYESLFKANKIIGNRYFMAKPHLTESSTEQLFVEQEKLDWNSFNDIQKAHLTSEGIYITGELLNWLGIYHYDDYIIIGGSAEFIKNVCIYMYGNTDWQSKFTLAFLEGEISMYQSDYDALKKCLFSENE